MARTSVFLVRGTVVEGSIYDWINLIKLLLLRVPSVMVVSTEEEAASRMISESSGMKDSAVVFFTKWMFSRAQALKEQNPDLLVMLLTADPHGLPTDQGVLIFDKGAFFDRDAFEKAILA